ncbi:hypothetical protein HG536_0H01100 [Torulaspora globosa]|uniref:Uncharacterized protein n=1 Tax=Torulaspora globosa TaxID=48254 RepID=A0A7G3ZMJ9_9SACH|nr:uncharacterized protein HG536_0H01100 [Torulaspora globosa]QLL34735.1 hypothetical protein HG536_0H01100 [Torulaspora globosa]
MAKMGNDEPSDAVPFSTPIKRKQAPLPETPNKRGRSSLAETVNITPSKAPRLVQPVARSAEDALKRGRLIFQSGHTDSDESSATDSDCSPWSDAGSISPLSDISSVPSSSPELEKLSYLDAFATKSILEKETMELNRRICSSVVKTRWRSSFEPCHRYKSPKRPILRPRNNSLNLLVRSSRGSLEDATIYATEINASITAHANVKMPMINNAYERMTIPVNSAIKRKHKLLKKALLGDDYEINEADFDVPDAALIEGFEIKAIDGGEEMGNGVRQIQWADRLAV